MRVTGCRRVWLAFAVAAGALSAGCGCWGDDDDDDGVPIIDVDAQGRVVLGSLGGATLQVYRVGDYSTPVATTTTSTGASLPEIGNFSFSVAQVPADALFLLVATGGSAYDSNEDGVLDPPVTNLGAVHALATAAQLDAGGVLVSAITEVVYQRVRYFLQALYDEGYVTRAADSWSSFVVQDDIAGGPDVDLDDAIAFDPLLHAGALFRPYLFYASVVILVLGNGPVTETAFLYSEEEVRFELLDPSSTWGLDLVGTLAYVGRRGLGLDVWDVSNPAAPTFLGNYDTPGSAFNVQVVGNLAYVADASGLQIVDVTNPALPTLAGAVTVGGGSVQDVHVVGDRAYLADDTFLAGMLHVVDVSNPAAPSVLGSAPAGSGAVGVRALGDFAYVLGNNRFETFDVSDPTAPSSEGTTPTAQTFSSMDLAQGRIYVAGGLSFQVFGLGSPATPQEIGSTPIPSGSVDAVRVVGSQALVAGGFDGVNVVDVSDPTAPVFVGIIPASGGLQGVDREGNLIVATEVNGGLNVIAGGVPVPSAVVESVPVAAAATAVDAVGNRAYVTTTGPNQLVVFDSTDPLALSVLGSRTLVTGFAVGDMDVEGSLAYVAEGGIQIYDATNPADPTPGDGDGTLSGAFDVDVVGSVAYTGWDTQLGVYSVSGATISFATSLPIAGTARGVAYDGSAIVLCAGFPGVVTFDATTPLAPVQSGTLSTQQALDVALAPPYAFVSDFSGLGTTDGLLVVDYSTLASPSAAHFVDLPGSVGRVVRSGSLVFVSAHVNGINVVDASTPTSAFHMGSVPVPSRVENLAVAGGFVYVAMGVPSSGIAVLRAPVVAVP